MTAPVLAVIRLSDSFASLWDELAEEAGMRVVAVPPGADPPTETAAVVIAAGGEEGTAGDAVPAPAPAGTPVWVVGASDSHRFAVEAMRAGAADYFALPDDLDRLRRTVAARADALRERLRRSDEYAARDDVFAELVGASTALRKTLETARRVLDADVTVLIGGETGTGKELLARALHEGGPRATGPFVPINCAAIPAQLLESELFGHERGAFTDAHRARAGLFEEADGGTLFLDEIGHLPLPLQGKLLRALEDRQIRRVGSNQTRPVDVRIIAATLVHLADAVKSGAFREDLYYRLNVVHLTLPPLRDRGDDVILLAETFLEQLAARYSMEAPPLTAPVRDALTRHAWPGNVRELRHAVERALLLSPPGTLDPAQLAPEPAAALEGSTLPFPATLDDIMRAAALAMLARQDGNKSAAARALDISRTRLQRLLDRTEGSDAGDA